MTTRKPLVLVSGISQEIPNGDNLFGDSLIQAGIAWTARAAAEANNWNGIAYGNGLFVSVADIGTNRVMTSPDGVTWTARSAAQANSWSKIAYGGGLFVTVSIDGTNRVMTSPDGITWTARTAAEANLWRRCNLWKRAVCRRS